MAFKGIKRGKSGKKSIINTATRVKLGLTQAQIAALFGVSRPYIALAEKKKRNLHSSVNTVLLNMFLHFHELETGSQSAIRSLETRAFMNAEYKKILPKMAVLEQEYRLKLNLLKEELKQMKENARNAEHSIIVFTKVINELREQEKFSLQTQRQLKGLNLFKQQAYNKLLTCWEPEQAKLHGKIEAIAGEAKALRRYRVKVMREHNPLKSKRY